MCRKFTKIVKRCIDCPNIGANLDSCIKTEKKFLINTGYPIPVWCPLPKHIKNSDNLVEKQNDQPTRCCTQCQFYFE